MRKQGSLDGIILLVISFSVINYVVSRASACEGRRFFFYAHFLGIKKRNVTPRHFVAAPEGALGEDPQTPSRVQYLITELHKKVYILGDIDLNRISIPWESYYSGIAGTLAMTSR